MYDHLGLKVGNLDASVRFYTAALAPLGHVLCSRDEGGAGFGPKGEPALWLYLHKGASGAGAPIAFRARDHAAIRKFHAEGLKAGGRDNGGAGPRADYSPTYFAAFLIDPDGNNVEAVSTCDRAAVFHPKGSTDMASIHKELSIDARPEDVGAAVADFGAVHRRL